MTTTKLWESVRKRRFKVMLHFYLKVLLPLNEPLHTLRSFTYPDGKGKEM